MLCDYDKSEKAQMERDARNKQELEYYTRLNAAKKEGREEGKEELIKSMHESGMSAEAIAKVCKLELNYVLDVLK